MCAHVSFLPIPPPMAIPLGSILGASELNQGQFPSWLELTHFTGREITHYEAGCGGAYL